MKEKALTGVAFAVGNVCATYPAVGSRPKASSRDDPEVELNTTSSVTSALSEPCGLTQVTWETTLYQPVFRKLVNESSRTFLALQKSMSDEENERTSSAQLLRFSKQYRSVMRDCQETLDKWSENPNLDEETREAYIGQSELLYKLELMWNLIEVLCIEKNPIILPSLLQWISLHFPKCDEKAKNVLGASGGQSENIDEYLENPESHPDFWDAVVLYVIQGRTENARKLLRLHSDFNFESFASIDELLRKMPRFAVGQTAADFEFRWRHWQTEVVARIDEGDYATSPQLGFIAKILAGDEATFKEDVLGKCETWYEWLVGKLLYTNPSIRSYDLPYHAEEAITNFGGLGSMTTLDSVLLAVMEMDMSQVMNELCNTLDNFWYPAHLLDLLHHSGSLESNLGQQNEQIQAGASLREFLLLEYATCLMTHNSLWQVGALYLDHCPVQGKQRLELLLERVPLTSERKAEKVLNIAAERGMASLTTSICKVMGMKCLHQNQLGNAMTWALRSQDSTFTTYLADKLLKLYCESGTFSSGDLLDHLGVSMVVSDRLTFLAKYREFHSLAGNGDYTIAAALLHSLLWSRLAPKYFWVTLLKDTLPFLAESVSECINDENGRKAFFSSEQTYELIHCLHELKEEIEELPTKQKNLLVEHEAELRRKLAINLSVALMQENDASAVKNMAKQSKSSIPAF